MTRPTTAPNAPTRHDSDWRLSLTGTNFCLRLAPALAVGGFDERYSYFLEETDIQRRLVDLGGRMGFTPDAEVHHAFAASARREADRVPTDYATILASLVIFCRKFARGPEWRRAIAGRVGTRLAEIEARLILLQARGLIDRRRALALLRSALRGVRRGAAARPAPMTSIASEEPGEGFLRFAPTQDRQTRSLRIALAGGADPQDRDALEALASELAKLGHEATVIFRAPWRDERGIRRRILAPFRGVAACGGQGVPRGARRRPRGARRDGAGRATPPVRGAGRRQE